MFEEHLGLIFFLWIVGASTLFAMLISTQVDRMNHCVVSRECAGAKLTVSKCYIRIRRGLPVRSRPRLQSCAHKNRRGSLFRSRASRCVVASCRRIKNEHGLRRVVAPDAGQLSLLGEVGTTRPSVPNPTTMVSSSATGTCLKRGSRPSSRNRCSPCCLGVIASPGPPIGSTRLWRLSSPRQSAM